jgi:methylmalonyl-CoA mutase N-terminal domain/subunit
VNAFVETDEPPLDTLVIGQATEDAQRAAVLGTRAARDAAATEAALAALTEACRDPDADLMAPLIGCARARCTEGEVTRAMQSVFGVWREAPRF